MKIIHVLDDIGQPTSCEDWGNVGMEDIPPIIDGTSISNNSLMRSWFLPDPDTGALYPITIFINHEMQVEDIYFRSLERGEVNFLINGMLNDM